MPKVCSVLRCDWGWCFWSEPDDSCMLDALLALLIARVSIPSFGTERYSDQQAANVNRNQPDRG